MTAHVRVAFAEQAWWALTDAHRMQWNLAAQQWSNANRVGLVRSIGGRMLYMKCKLRVLALGETLTTPDADPARLSDAVPVVTVYPGGPIRVDVLSPSGKHDTIWHAALQRTFRETAAKPGVLMRSVYAVGAGRYSFDVDLTGENGFAASPRALEAYRWKLYTHAHRWPSALEYWGTTIARNLGPELVYNGTMAAPALGAAVPGWTVNGTGASQEAVAAGWSLPYSLKVTATAGHATFGLGTYSNLFSVVPATYELRLAYRMTGDAPSYWTLRDGLGGIYYPTGLTFTVDDKWHVGTGTFACLGTSSIAYMFAVWPTGAVDHVWIDNVTLRKVL